MMSRFFALTVAMVLVLGNPVDTFAQFSLGDSAQGGGGSGGDDLAKEAEKVMREQEGTNSPDQLSVDYLPNLIQPLANSALTEALAEQKDSGGSAMSGGPTGPGNFADTRAFERQDTGQQKSKAPKPRAGNIQDEAYKFGPVGLQRDILAGKVLTELISKNFKKGMIQKGIIQGNTEPAAFSFAMSMVEFAGAHADLSVDIVDAARQQYINADWTGELALDFDACMSKNMDQKEKGSFAAAVSFCMNDELESKNAKAFDKTEKNEKSWYEDRIFNREKGGGPAADLRAAGQFDRQAPVGGAGNDDHTLTKELFRDIDGMQAQTQEEQKSKDAAKKMAESYKKLVGDYKWDDNKKGKGAAAVADSKIVKTGSEIPPTDATKIIGETLGDVYENLTKLMKEYCEYKKQASNSSKEPYQFQMEIFWSPQDKKQMKEKFDKISMPGYRFTPVIGEMFWRIFEKDRTFPVSGGGGGGGGGNALDCNDIKPSKKIPTVDEAKDDWEYIYGMYATRVGWGQMLARYEQLYNFTESWIRRPYQRVINDTLFMRAMSMSFKNSDFFAAQQHNRADVLKLIQELGGYMQNRTGHGGVMKPNENNALISLGQDEGGESTGIGN